MYLATHSDMFSNMYLAKMYLAIYSNMSLAIYIMYTHLLPNLAMYSRWAEFSNPKPQTPNPKPRT